MADKKISELVNLTSLAADDEFVVVDAGANATKRTTYDTLATEIRTEAEALSGTTGTFTGDITSNGETVYHRGNILGTVSQSGGTPTGAVIERGSNANGEYVKFADGTMICTAKFGMPYNNSNRLETSLTFPATFSTSPVLSINNGNEATGTAPTYTALRGFFALDSSSTTGNSRVGYNDNTVTFQSGDSMSCSFIAIGRWF